MVQLYDDFCIEIQTETYGRISRTVALPCAVDHARVRRALAEHMSGLVRMIDSEFWSENSAFESAMTIVECDLSDSEIYAYYMNFMQYSRVFYEHTNEHIECVMDRAFEDAGDIVEAVEAARTMLRETLPDSTCVLRAYTLAPKMTHAFLQQFDEAIHALYVRARDVHNDISAAPAQTSNARVIRWTMSVVSANELHDAYVAMLRSVPRYYDLHTFATQFGSLVGKARALHVVGDYIRAAWVRANVS